MPRSVKAVCAQIVEEDGDLVREAIRRGLEAPPPASALYVKMVLEYSVGKPVPMQPPKNGKGLVIVLSSQEDPLAARSRPTKPIDLTLGARSALDMPAASVGAPAGVTPQTPAREPRKALPTGRVAATTAALQQPVKKETAPAHFDEVITNAKRVEGRAWIGDCPDCGGRQMLTWTGDAKGGATEVECERGGEDGTRGMRYSWYQSYTAKHRFSR